MPSTINTQVIFRKVPTTYPVKGEHLEVARMPFSPDTIELAPGDFILKNLVLSVDPYMRVRMRIDTNPVKAKSVSDPVPINGVMTGGGIGLVIRSNNERFSVGDYAEGMIGWEEYTVVRSNKADSFQLRNDAKNSGLPLTYYVGVLGMPGITAYIGLLKIGDAKPGETLFITSAAGAVGQLVGQIGKLKGMRVVGSAGDDAKVRFVLEECGYDAAFNYKTRDTSEALTEMCPGGIDVYFENVGGKTLDIVLEHAKNFARIAVCGMVSQYNREKPEGVYNLENVLWKRLRIQGFIFSDHIPEYGAQFQKDVMTWLKEGKIKYKEDVVVGIENAPDAFIGMLKGKNFGKQVVKIADP
ncbi:hypothetical protein BC938DRAFT_479628 [Jimgerdemannia flammicorona]|uniref:Enoyl reductase (ER) domain-containing protein n=1 Tax=Jimgerdemannia flammicorona TaxID=994334 RepID=A0A433QXN9_9FUNG|nr:hypothetical protein BC938DRAFT_479628 [Jimgerdemannia flammicorona]RUS34581.1 hypothetical protein BC938DRAFT_479628 [Jimgerdemannia flammicorona]